MAVTITDRRTIINEAESVTDWTGAGFGVVSADVAEATNAVAASIGIGDQPIYHTEPTGSGIVASGTLVYVYSFNNALQNSWDNTIPPNGLLIGDGTNRIAFHMAGADKRVFNHLDGPTNWQCLVLDGDKVGEMDDAGNTYVDAGSVAALDLTNITQVGAYHQTLSKALGGGYHIACDILRYGNDGIYITGGGVGTEGKFSEIAVADSSTADQAGHGILRAYTTVAFGVQGPLTFGNVTASGNAYFNDSGIVVVYEARNVADDKYYFNVEGRADSTNSFELSSSTITTAEPAVAVSVSGSMDVFDLDTVSFIDLKNPITFACASGTVTNCVFATCGQIDPGTLTFTGNAISSTTASGNGALLLDSDGSDNWANLTINFYEQGHGIYITASGTYTFDNIQMVGYGATGTSDAAIYNNSGGVVTINATNGSSGLTYLNGAGASTSIVSSVTITLTGLVSSSEIRVYDEGTQTELDGIENSGTSFGFTLNNAVYPYVDIVVHHLGYEYFRINSYEVPALSASLPIAQRVDRWYSNP